MLDIRLCLLGAGRWGKRYIETISRLDGVRLTALGSRNPDSASLVPADCRIYSDWGKALRAPDIQGVVIATPPRLHKEMTCAAIDAGLPVLVEKPLTLSPDEAYAIEQYAGRKSVLVMVGHTHLFNPAFREMKRHVPAIGAIREIRTDAGDYGPFRTDITPLWDWAPHDLSMCLDLLGEPNEVSIDQVTPQRFENGWSGNYRIKLRFPSDVRVDVYIGNIVSPKCRRLEISGDLGTLVLDDIASTLVLCRDGAETPIPFSKVRPLALQVGEFAKAIGRRATSDSSLRLGRQIVEIIARCDLDVAQGSAQ